MIHVRVRVHVDDGMAIHVLRIQDDLPEMVVGADVYRIHDGLPVMEEEDVFRIHDDLPMAEMGVADVPLVMDDDVIGPEHIPILPQFRLQGRRLRKILKGENFGWPRALL